MGRWVSKQKSIRAHECVLPMAMPWRRGWVWECDCGQVWRVDDERYWDEVRPEPPAPALPEPPASPRVYVKFLTFKNGAPNAWVWREGEKKTRIKVSEAERMVAEGEAIKVTG